MPRPRADFSCKPCQVKAGVAEPVIHENLPVTSLFCPYSGKRRGFKRLFNAVQVSTTGHRVARFIDRRLGPQSEKHAAIKSSSKEFASGHKAAMEKTYELAPPEQREQIAKLPQLGAASMTAAAAFGSIDPQARRDSRNYTYPMIKRQVVPEWTR